MIPEYKLYHGAVLAELIHHYSKPLSVDELAEQGRLTSYILDGQIGLQIKHSTQRLNPWQFTFTPANVLELDELKSSFLHSFIVLVCHTDGMVCLTVEELKSLLAFGESNQGWLRVTRRRGKWYSVAGGAAVLPRKRPDGLDPILATLDGAREISLVSR